MTIEGEFKSYLRKAFQKVYGSGGTEVMTGAIGVALGQPSGLPDRYFGANGNFMWVEAKVRGKHKVTSIQDLQLTRLANCGQQAFVFTLCHYNTDKKADWDIGIQLYLKGGCKVQFKNLITLATTNTQQFWDYLFQVKDNINYDYWEEVE